MEISITFSIPDITNCWRQMEDRHSKYTHLSNMGRNILLIIAHAVRKSAICNSDQMPFVNLPDTLVALTGASKYL
jgi:hypothetical protein